MKKTIVISLCLLLVFVTILASCSNGDRSAPPPSDTNQSESSASTGSTSEAIDVGDIHIALMPKLIGIPFFNATERGGKRASEDIGFQFSYVGPTEPDATQQFKMVEDLIAQGNINAIAVAPNDPAGLSPVLRRAKDAGIKVLDWDTPAEEGIVDYSIRTFTDQAMGEHVWQMLIDEIGKDEGNYAILTGGLEAVNLNTWIDIGIEWCEANYPNMKLVTDKIPTNEKQQEAYSKTLDLVKSYPELDGIVCFGTPTPVGAGQAIQELGLQDAIVVVGTGMPQDCAPYLKDGSLDAVTLFNVENLGYLAAYIAYLDVIGGEVKDGMDVPSVGNVQVLEDGKTVILGAPLDFTAENVDNYNF